MPWNMCGEKGINGDEKKHLKIYALKHVWGKGTKWWWKKNTWKFTPWNMCGKKGLNGDEKNTPEDSPLELMGKIE